MPNLPYSAKARRHLTATSARMAKLIAEVGHVKFEQDPHETVFESLASSIFHQQLTGKAAKTIMGRFQALHGDATKFPSPEKTIQTPLEDLRKVGLSNSKARAILDLAQRVIEKKVPTREQILTWEDSAIIEALIEVRGIGPWTAQMFLLFTLGRPDVWPIDDYGVRKGFAVVHGKKELPSPKELQK